MSGEQRVTDDDLALLVSPSRILNATPESLVQMLDALALDLRDERTAHRATEAKLRAALAEVERLKVDLEDGLRSRKWLSEDNAAFLDRATAAESALAATKAKLEAALDAHRQALAVADRSMVHPDLRIVLREMRGISLSALTKETTDAK